MSTVSISTPFPIFTDIDGQPLENGYIFIGIANLGPIGNPINVYWDAALTIPAAQPIRTLGGYPINNGTPARLYVNSNYSIQVQNRNGSVVYSAPVDTEFMSSANVSYTPAGTGAVATTVQAKLREIVSLTDSGADPTGATDSRAAIQLALDNLQPHQTLEASGTFLMSGDVYVKKSNNTYDFRSAKFIMAGTTYTGFGAGFFFGDPTTKTTRPQNITVLGGEYYPAGDSAAYPLANFNPLAVVIGENITFQNPRIFPKQSTRAFTLQTDNTYGDGVNPNIKNVRVYGLMVMGDGNAVDGVDVTSLGGDGLIQEVYIEGYVSGCKRGANVSTGSNLYNFDTINLDLTVFRATEVAVNFLRVTNSQCNFNLLDVTKQGAQVAQIYNCNLNFLITGIGGSLTSGLVVAQGASSLGQNRISAKITGAFPTALLPQHQDIVYPNIDIDGAVLGIDVSGFRSTWGLVVFKNCTAFCDNFEADTDKWGLVISQGAGANPVVIKRESDFVTTLPNGNATPSVTGATFCRTSGSTALTGFTGGMLGQQITLMADQNITITQGTNIKLSGGVNYAMTLFDTITLVTYAADVWVEVSRSVNA
jgi:hypothetical protein